MCLSALSGWCPRQQCVYQLYPVGALDCNVLISSTVSCRAVMMTPRRCCWTSWAAWFLLQSSGSVLPPCNATHPQALWGFHCVLRSGSSHVLADVLLVCRLATFFVCQHPPLRSVGTEPNPVHVLVALLLIDPQHICSVLLRALYLLSTGSHVAGTQTNTGSSVLTIIA
jgi:hypothetical protein